VSQEIEKIFNYFFITTYDNKEQNFKLHTPEMVIIDTSKPYPQYSNIFNILYKLLEIIVDKNEAELVIQVLSLLISINKKINEDHKKEKKSKDIIFFLLKYIKFLNKIIFNDLFNNVTTLVKNTLIFTLSETINLCQNELFLYSNILLFYQYLDRQFNLLNLGKR
jgi:elongation factor P--beta-lysine ligase